MLLHLDRDSVAAGDDVDPHAISIEVDAEIPLALVLTRVMDDGYLPKIFGGRATWVVRTEQRGRALAVVAQEWTAPQVLVAPETSIGRSSMQLFFEYLAQRDPNEVLAELR